MSEIEELREENRQLKQVIKSYNRLEKLLFPPWFDLIQKADKKDKQHACDLAFDGISKFKAGEETNEGNLLRDFLLNESEFIGLIPNIIYTKVIDNVRYCHAFGQRTLLFKHKVFPMLMVVNSSIRLNESALADIKENKEFNDIFNLQGVTG